MTNSKNGWACTKCACEFVEQMTHCVSLNWQLVVWVGRGASSGYMIWTHMVPYSMCGIYSAFAAAPLHIKLAVFVSTRWLQVAEA